MIEWKEVTKPQTNHVPTSPTCDACGKSAEQPKLMTVGIQGRFEQVRKPDNTGNEARLERVADLCHECADQVVEFINSQLTSTGLPGGSPDR